MLDNLIAYIVEKYGPIKGKKALQKIFYFLTEMGVPTNLTYSLYHYGPYSSDLDIQTGSFEHKGAISIKKSGFTYIIDKGIFTETYANSEEMSRYSKQIDEIVNKLPIKNPMKMELYSTTHYASSVIEQIYGITDIEDVKNEVKRIKKEKFSENEIKEAYIYLKENGYIN